MRMLLIGALVMSASCSPKTKTGLFRQGKDLAYYQQEAKKYKSLLTLPDLDLDAGDVNVLMDNTLKTADQKLDQVAALKRKGVTFDSTLRVMADIFYDVTLVGNRLYFVWNTSTDKGVRDQARRAVEKAEKWQIKTNYREDLYNVVKALQRKKPKLSGEDKRLFDETLKEYRRNGLHLAKDKREAVERLKAELAKLSLEFQNNINNAKQLVTYTRTELEGLSDGDLKRFKKGDHYEIDAKIYSQYSVIMRNAKDDQARKKTEFSRGVVAKDKNRPLLKKILLLRAQIAKTLGYNNWAAMKLEPKMARNEGAVMSFLNRLNRGLKPKMKAEIKELLDRKIADTKNPKAKLNSWDLDYYFNLISKEKYQIDHDALKVYFPLDRTLQGMFAIYEKIFALTFEEVQPAYRWVDDLRLFAVLDKQTREPLGFFYLDLFPREGKYSHFAMFPMVGGYLRPEGLYQRPTVALVCNFPRPSGDKPSLLKHDEVETLFHEFGHAMHGVLTRAKFDQFSGTSVPQDFVEAPSQMLENWVWDKDVLDTFAADYRDPKKKFPRDMLERMDQVRKASIGRDNRRQIAYGLIDMNFHRTTRFGGKMSDLVAASSRFLKWDDGLPEQDGTSFVTRFGHLMGGYDAGYYGYLWAKAISADMASVFKKSEKKFFDTEIGMRLRKEIYEVGESRDVNQSIRKFLGRSRSLKPFLEDLGIGS